MSTVAFVACAEFPGIFEDDWGTAEVLRQHGIKVVSANWHDPEVPWLDYDLVVIRSPWDYHQRADAYTEWLRRCQDTGVALQNAPATVLANLNKRYLLDLEAVGVPIVPTCWYGRDDPRDLLAVISSLPWDEVVIKPAISAGAWRTVRWHRRLSSTSSLAELLDHPPTDWLIQEYLPEIEIDGEWSLHFFDGHFSHAIRKLPASGDFRVQAHHGGRTVAATPTSELLRQAKAVLAHAPRDLLYARVDGVVRNGTFLLMELELNEPALYLRYGTGAAERFAGAILRRLDRASHSLSAD